MNTPPLVRSAYGAKPALALRMGRIGEIGKRAGEQAFDNGSRKPVLLALSAVALIPIKAISLQIHGNRKDRQLYRQMSRLMDGGKSYPFAQHRAGDYGKQAISVVTARASHTR
jgi:hypothetical protein